METIIYLFVLLVFDIFYMLYVCSDIKKPKSQYQTDDEHETYVRNRIINLITTIIAGLALIYFLFDEVSSLSN